MVPPRTANVGMDTTTQIQQQSQITFSQQALANTSASDTIRAQIPQQPYPPGATLLQKRDADRAYNNDVTALVNAVANHDMEAFTRTLARLAPNFPNPNTLFNIINVDLLHQEEAIQVDRAARAQVAGNARERNLALDSGLTVSMALESLGEPGAQRSFLKGVGDRIDALGGERGMQQEQIDQAKEDMLMAAQQLGFSNGAVIGAAIDLNIHLHPSNTHLRAPDGTEAQTVLDAIRINAMMRSGEIMQRMQELDRQVTAERDPKARRQKEEEYAELARELTRLMGRETPGREGGEGGNVRLNTGDITGVVGNHMDALIAIHTGQLDRVVVSRRPPQMAV